MASAPVMPANLTAAEMKEWIEANPQPVEQAPPVENEEVVIDPETGEPFEQPRDEKGRFVSTDPDAGLFEATVEKEIDLGDGSGVQLFRGTGQGTTQEEATIAAHEALADELAKAQTNATRKIQELSRRAPEPPKEPTLTPDEEMALSQQLLSNPSKVLREMQEKAKRDAVEEIQRQQEAAQRAAAEAHEAAVTFVKANPDFYPCPENQERIERYMKLYQLPQNLDGINQAYAAVKDILKTKPVEQPRTPAARSSAISTRHSPPAPVVTKPAGVDEEAFKRYCEENGLPVPAPLRRKF